MSGQPQSNGSLRMRRRSSAWFTSNNPILFLGQFGYETDTAKLKLGDGQTRWNSLPYMDTDASDDSPGGGGALTGLLRYTYSNNTSATGISAGQVRFNSTTRASITKAYIHNTDGLSIDQSNYFDLFTSGVLNLYNSSPDGMLAFKVTRMIERTGYHEFDVVPLSGVMPSNNDTVRIDAKMDAPGVRVYKADIEWNGTAWIIGNVHMNSLRGAPSINTSNTDDFTLALTDAFPQSSTHAITSMVLTSGSTTDAFARAFNNDESGIIKIGISYASSAPNSGDAVAVQIEVTA